MHDNVQLFKWTEQVLVHTYFNQAFVFLVYSHVFLSLYRTRLSVLAPQNYWSFSTIFICVFFQAAACKRPLWTEDHFSHCSFVCWEDSTWVGVGINNQIQGAGSRGGGGALQRSLGRVLCHQGLQTPTLFQTKIIHFTTLFKTRNPISGSCLSCFVHEPLARKIVQTLPTPLTLNKLFYSILHVFCFLLFHTQNQVIFKTNITQLYTCFWKRKKMLDHLWCIRLYIPKRHPVQDAKWWNSEKTLKTTPCWVAHTHLAK